MKGSSSDDPSQPTGVDASPDPSAREVYAEEIERLSRLYAALSQINQAILASQDREALFRSVCRALVEHGGLSMAWIGWHDAQTRRLVPAGEWGDREGYVGKVAVYADERAEGRGPSGTAYRTGRPYICNDLAGDPALVPWQGEAARSGYRASAAIPILREGECQGVLNVYASDAGFFRDREIALLLEAVQDLSFGLENIARELARREAEAKVRSERDFSDAVLNSLPGVLYVYDEQRNFLRWNKNFESVTGYAADELALLGPLDVITEADRTRVHQRIEQVFREGKADVEAGLLTKDGRTIPYYFTGIATTIGNTPCLSGVGLDLTEQKSAEAAKRAMEARYRTLFDHAPDGILIADQESYYLDANASMCQMLGYEHEELVGKHAADIVVPSELEHVEPALGAIKARSAYHREWQLRRKDGSVFSAEVMVTMMPDGNLLAMIRDITERKKADAALRGLNETLELKVAERTEELRAAVQRAEAADRVKSAFLATMSHELRTPLNSILGFTGILLQRMAGPLTDEQARQLGMVRGSARHLLELINDVLDISKIEAEQLEVYAEPFDLRATLEQVTASVRPLAERRGLSLTCEVSAAPEEIVSDRRRVHQIVLNLLQNAIKFTEQGGVTITACTTAAEASEPAPPRVRIRVEDTGIGISREDLPTVFAPFKQIDSGLSRQREGTGLGLAICGRLAKLLGGDIAVESEPARGSAFTLTLPLSKDPIS